jgi:hypothetical protein
MGLKIERDHGSGEIVGVTVTPEMPESLAPDEALLTVILDPSDENVDSGAKHSDQRVRWAVALHPHLTAKAAATLAGDGSADVRRALASNPGTPIGVLERLGEAEDLAVANTALRTLVAKLRGTDTASA